MASPYRLPDLIGLSLRYRGALLAYFMRQFQDSAYAEDLTQEVFTRLATMARREGINNIEGYVFRVAKNLVRDAKRRRSVRANYIAEAQTDAARGIETRDAERQIIARQALIRIVQILDRVPERTRSIFVLHRMEAMPRKDIAEAYGISVSAVEKHLGKVMALLMNDQGEDQNV